MNNTFWVKRFFTVTGGAFALLALVYLARGRSLNQALSEAFVWGIISGAIFTAVNVYRYKQGQHCAYCGDMPGEQGNGQCER